MALFRGLPRLRRTGHGECVRSVKELEDEARRKGLSISAQVVRKSTITVMQSGIQDAIQPNVLSAYASIQRESMAVSQLLTHIVGLVAVFYCSRMLIEC